MKMCNETQKTFLFVCLFFSHLLPLILGSGAKLITKISWWITQWRPKKPPKRSQESRDPGQLLKSESLCSEMEVRDVCGGGLMHVT